MARNITFEPCTLVYTLINPDKLSFDDFDLLVRSNHKYMCEKIIANRDTNSIQVNLKFQASVINFTEKLNHAAEFINVTKLSAFVKESEFSRLEELRRQFGIGGGEHKPGKSTTTRARKSTARSAKMPGKPRKTPYKLPQRTVYIEEEDETICSDQEEQSADVYTHPAGEI